MSLETKKFEFGEFCLDTDENVLLRGVERVSLTPKTLQLLEVLVRNAGRVVTKEELMGAVWSESFVEESNLTFTVTLLRKALGDNSRSPNFIETIPKRGYRFIAAVSEPSDLVETDAILSPVLPTSSGYGKWALGLFGVAVLAVGGVWFTAGGAGVRPSYPLLSEPFSVEQLSNTGGSEYAAISPDGKYAVYSSRSGGKQSLWLRHLNSSETVQILPPSDDEYLDMSFSNSGNSVYFVRKPLNSHILPSLYRIEPFGGVPEKVIDFAMKRPSFSPDDKKLAFVRCQFKREEFCAAYIADINGQNERKIATTENGVHIWELRFSPDGRRLAIAKGRYSSERNDAGIYEVDSESGAEKEFFSERFADIAGMDWLPDGSGILFSALNFRDGKASIWQFTEADRSVKLLSRDAASYTQLGLDRAGSKLLAVQQSPNFKIHSVVGGKARTLTESREIARSSWPDTIVYVSYDGEIWSMNSEGLQQRQLTNSKVSETSLFLSPDGKTIFFSSDENNGRNIWKMNADGSERKQLTQADGGFVVGLSDNGAVVYYLMAMGGGLFKVSSEGGTPTLLVEKALVNPAVSPDGKYVAHFVIESMIRKIAIMELETQKNVKLITPQQGGFLAKMLVWSSDSKNVNYVLSSNGNNTLWYAGPATDPVKAADLSSGEMLSFTSFENGRFSYVTGDWRFDAMLIEGLN